RILHVEAHLLLQRQGEEAPRPVELRVDQRLRHTMVGDIEEPGLAAGLVDLPRDLAAGEIEHRDGPGGDGWGVGDHIRSRAISRRRRFTLPAERLYPSR